MPNRLKDLAAALALALASAAGGALAEPARRTPPVRVESGQVAGIEAEGVRIFRDVPYAAAPVGQLRWAPPRPAPAWRGVRDASAIGPSCPQRMNPDGKPNLGAANGPTQEDCLRLNIFAPKAALGAPVMVWLHGGGHRAGAGWIYDGSNFARDGVVLVAINYRLGPLGYFAHPALTQAAAPGEPVGNYGLMDQIAALKWVARNIAAFGGDPGNVTVFGESAGGASVLALLATPASRGLYRRAIVQSGGGWSPPVTLAQMEARGVAAVQELGLSRTATAEQLRALPVDRLIAQVDGGFGPFLDGRLMKEPPAQAFARGHANDVPLIIGANSGEDSLLPEYRARPPEVIAPLPPEGLKAYAGPAALGDAALAQAVFGDRIMVAPARWIAARASGGRPAWLYHFDYVGTRFRPVLTRAFHAAEIQYVFEYWGRRTPMSAVSDEDRAMASLIHSCWVAFARAGTPACASGPAWPAYDPASDRLMAFGSPSAVRAGFLKARLDAQDAAVPPTLELAP